MAPHEFKAGTKPKGPSLTTQRKRRVTLTADLVRGTGDAEEEVSEASAPHDLPSATDDFDPWLRCRKRIPDAMADNLSYWYAGAHDPSNRRYSEDRREAARVLIATVFANLANAVACGHELPAVAVSLRAAKQKQTRYSRPGFAALPAVLSYLARNRGDQTILTLVRSRQRGAASVILPGATILDMVTRGRIKPADFYREPGGEVILLTRTQRNGASADGKALDWIDYAETPETERMREEVRTVNAFLAKAPVTFEADGGEPVPIERTELRRHFKLLEADTEERFDRGGRLFGGWWQDLKSERRQSIRIKGQPIADLDFANMFLRLAYLEAGHEPPEGDLYAVGGRLAGPQWRGGVKIVTNAMLFRQGPMKRLPKDPELRTKLPPRTTGAEARQAILEAHPALAGVFETGIGFRLMFTESQILMAALLRLLDDGIPALPMHDGVMVPQSSAAAAGRRMADAAETITGARLRIELKSIII